MFKIKLADEKLFLQAIRNRVSGDCGTHLLEKPMEKVSVRLECKGKFFNLISTVEFDFNIRHSDHNVEEKVRRILANQYGKMVERGGSYIVTSNYGVKFVLSKYSIGLDDMVISTGCVDGFMDKIQVIPAPAIDAKNLPEIVADFIELVELAVKEAYKYFGKAPPDEEFLIHTPKQRANRGHNGMMGGMDEVAPEVLLGKLEIERPNIAFEDIGGQVEAKREIEGLAFALKNPELYQKWGTKPPKGIILYGPPGTGKTLMAKALATQADATFYRVEASDISSKWYGESEKIVKMIFELANSNEGNTIIFFDEIDAIALKRDGAHEASQRVMGTLLENLDGLDSHKNVMVVASTNRLNAIEPALLRPGRFDRWVEVKLPDEIGKKQIFDIHIAKAESVSGRNLFNGIDFSAVLGKTRGFSGADIAEVVRRVLEEKVRLEGATEIEPGAVATDDMMLALATYERVKYASKKIKVGFASEDS